MDEQISIRKALRVFHKILSEGERAGDHYHLNGLTAYSDFDGYTATLCNDYVSLSIYFHNKFSFTFSNRKERSLFLKK